MEGTGRPEEMGELEWLVALEEIRQLKARRDRYADAHDWAAYEALHAPDHVSHNDGYAPWTSSKEMIENVGRVMGDLITVHHSYDPEIIFDTPTKARGIWAMTGAGVSASHGAVSWTIGYGYYYENYEKRDGRWMFTSRRWQDYFGTGSEGARLPKEPPKGSNAFDPDIPSGDAPASSEVSCRLSRERAPSRPESGPRGPKVEPAP